MRTVEDGKPTYLTLEVDPSRTTVLELKEKISNIKKIPIDQLNLNFAGKTLSDGFCLSVYNIEKGSSLNVYKRIPPGSKT